jgi:hypothetical protein
MDIQNIHRVYNQDTREQLCIFSLMKKIINYKRKWHNYMDQMEKYCFSEIFYASCERERGRPMKKLKEEFQDITIKVKETNKSDH